MGSYSHSDMATQRFGRLSHLWKDDNLYMNLRMCLYKVLVYSVLTYGSEAWKMTTEVAVASLNDTNSKMVITEKTVHVHEEVSVKRQNFQRCDMDPAKTTAMTIRIGQILRLTDIQIKHAVFEMYKNPTQGNLLMNDPKTSSWRELCTYVIDREYWRTRDWKMK